MKWHLEAMPTDSDEIPEALQVDYKLEFELHPQGGLTY